VAKFVRAWESADLDALVALLTDDVFMSMPPMPFEYEGRDVVARFCASIFRAGRRFDLVPTRANGQPAFGAYLRAPGGISHGTGLYILTLTGDRICAMTRFENAVLPWFGLSGEDFGTHIAARLSPFVVLLGKNGAGKAQDGIAVGEDADTSVLRRISLSSRSGATLGMSVRSLGAATLHVGLPEPAPDGRPGNCRPGGRDYRHR
jgi:hypothetical protein